MRRGTPDAKKLSRAFIGLALARAEAEARAQAAAGEADEAANQDDGAESAEAGDGSQ